VVQSGFDYMIDSIAAGNGDVKKIWLRPDWDGRLACGAAING
jgi:outer membrane protein